MSDDRNRLAAGLRDVRDKLGPAAAECEGALREAMREDPSAESAAWAVAHARRLEALGGVAEAMDRVEAATVAAGG